jgi:hypothetical protein
MRIAAIICAAGLLAGCNIVTSEKPLFFARDAAGQPQLRPGVWMDEKTGCDIDLAKPMDKWPDCADAWVVRPGEILAAHDTTTAAKPAADGWTHYPFVLARGEPAILQVAMTDDAGKAAYVYGGLRVLKRDAQNRAVEYKLWPALCGPPPSADASDTGDGMVTRHPIDGLVIDKKNHDCIASDPGPVRVSVTKSEAWNDADAKENEGRDRAKWVRDGEK